MKELIRKQNYSFYEDSQGSYWIEVVCGTIGLYEVKIKLLPEEVQKYKTDIRFLDDLAYKISRSPASYEKRKKI